MLSVYEVLIIATWYSWFLAETGYGLAVTPRGPEARSPQCRTGVQAMQNKKVQSLKINAAHKVANCTLYICIAHDTPRIVDVFDELSQCREQSL